MEWSRDNDVCKIKVEVSRADDIVVDQARD